MVCSCKKVKDHGAWKPMFEGIVSFSSYKYGHSSLQAGFILLILSFSVYTTVLISA